MIEAVRLALSWMTVLPVGRPGVPGERAAARAMTALPVVGLVCGVVAIALAHGAHALGAGAMLSGVIGVGALVVLTRGMHVDALADTADGLGSYAGADRALEIMRSGTIGPMGAAALVLVLVGQVAALGTLVDSGAWLAPIAAVVLSRCLPVVQLRRGIPAASRTGFGALVAGSQSRAALVTGGLACVVAGAALGGAPWTVEHWWAPVVGSVMGVATYAGAAAFSRHAVRRIGGINGDILGATIEIGTVAALVIAVFLL